MPHELTLEQNRWALQDHVRESTRVGRVVQVAIHEPETEKGGDARNIHAHLLISTRGVDENGFKQFKTREQQDRYLNRREYVAGLRENWENVANRHLERHKHTERIDSRSLEAQGIDRKPTVHLGPAQTHTLRKIARLEREKHELEGERNHETETAEPERRQQRGPVVKLARTRPETAIGPQL